MVRPEAFFLPTEAGACFCLFYSSALGQSRGSLLYIHPFIEEMNKTRRMAAEQSRRLSEAGWNVLQLDLTGCGDSEGDFGDATWTSWLADIRAAWQWLGQRAPDGQHWLWGARLGGLLAASFAASNADLQPEVDGLLLWQPVLSGSQHLTQFLRLRTVQNQLNQSGGENLQSLRAALASGQSLEIAGYQLAPGLALPMQSAELGQLERIPAKVRWFEISAQENAAISPASLRVADLWKQRDVDLFLIHVHGPAFWQTQEIEMCPELLEATVQALEQKNVNDQEVAINE